MLTPQGSGVVDLSDRVPARSGSVPTQPLRLRGSVLPMVGTARLYVCGITPYDVTHLGHAATFVWADLLTAVLESTGVSVLASRNVTDVDDVLTRAAETRGRRFDEFALTQEFLFARNMKQLRVAEPAQQPRARHHIAAVQQLAAALLATGAAYERDGHVLFAGSAVPERAGLGRDEALSLARARGDDPDDPVKDDPFDVPVWRPSGGSDPAWPSPWGWGRPGWHAECAAIAMAVHGASVDVVAGGEDLAFPHHAYQAAMAEAASGVRPFGRHALHVGSVRLDGERMAKSTGNLVLVEDLMAAHPPAAVRLMLLDRRYGDEWDYDVAAVRAAEARLERLYAAAGRATGDGGVEPAHAALRDDLAVPAALEIAEGSGGETARAVLDWLRLT